MLPVFTRTSKIVQKMFTIVMKVLCHAAHEKLAKMAAIRHCCCMSYRKKVAVLNSTRFISCGRLSSWTEYRRCQFYSGVVNDAVVELRWLRIQPAIRTTWRDFVLQEVTRSRCVVHSRWLYVPWHQYHHAGNAGNIVLPRDSCARMNSVLLFSFNAYAIVCISTIGRSTFSNILKNSDRKVLSAL